MRKEPPILPKSVPQGVLASLCVYLSVPQGVLASLCVYQEVYNGVHASLCVYRVVYNGGYASQGGYPGLYTSVHTQGGITRVIHTLLHTQGGITWYIHPSTHLGRHNLVYTPLYTPWETYPGIYLPVCLPTTLCRCIPPCMPPSQHWVYASLPYVDRVVNTLRVLSDTPRVHGRPEAPFAFLLPRAGSPCLSKTRFTVGQLLPLRTLRLGPKEARKASQDPKIRTKRG